MMTSAGIVVEIEDHLGIRIQVFLGINWRLGIETGTAGMAAAFIGNPYVWFGTINEPGNGDSDQELATYNAIRGTGNNNPIMLEVMASGYNPADYANMNNVIWDIHYYNWLSGYASDEPTNAATLANLVASTQAVADFPILIGEYGDSTDGSNIDPGGAATVDAVNTSGYGSAAWLWYFPGLTGNPGDELTDGNGNLSAYGQQVAGYIAAGQGAGAGCSAGGAPATGLAIKVKASRR